VRLFFNTIDVSERQQTGMRPWRLYCDVPPCHHSYGGAETGRYWCRRIIILWNAIVPD